MVMQNFGGGGGGVYKKIIMVFFKWRMDILCNLYLIVQLVDNKLSFI